MAKRDAANYVKAATERNKNRKKITGNIAKRLVTLDDDTMQKLTKHQETAIATAAETDERRIPNGIILRRSVKLVEASNSPYTDFDLRRFEIAVRKSVSVRVALVIRHFFAFGRPSKLVIELPDSETIGMKPEEITARIDQITVEQRDLLAKLQKRDERMIINKAISQLFFQQIIFARGVLVKGYPLQGEGILAEPLTVAEEAVTKLVSLNSRRLGLTINNPDDYNEFEGVYVDGQALDKASMIYMPHQPYNFSPYTDNYGYTPMEAVVDLASSSVTFDSEDTPEILKSAWLASILLKIDTSDLSDAKDKQERIDTITDNIDPGRFLGADKEMEAEKLDFDANFEGLSKFADRTDLKIFKALGIPQSLVQAEDTANKSTADSSATLFLDGVVSTDQNSMSDILWQQWYEPYVRELMGVSGESQDSDQQIGFKVMRRWDKATAEQFQELVNGVVQLVNSNIWDVQKANEKLQTPEVTQRVNVQMAKNNPLDPLAIKRVSVGSAAKSPPGGQWITTEKDQRIFIPEGEDLGDTVGRAIKRRKAEDTRHKNMIKRLNKLSPEEKKKLADSTFDQEFNRLFNESETKLNKEGKSHTLGEYQDMRLEMKKKHFDRLGETDPLDWKAVRSDMRTHYDEFKSERKSLGKNIEEHRKQFQESRGMDQLLDKAIKRGDEDTIESIITEKIDNWDNLSGIEQNETLEQIRKIGSDVSAAAPADDRWVTLKKDIFIPKVEKKTEVSTPVTANQLREEKLKLIKALGEHLKQKKP